MNLNADSIGEVSQETREFYAMADHQKVKKYVYGERLMTQEQKNRFASHFDKLSLLMGVSCTVGLVSYCYLLMPAGKVLRDLKDAQMTPQKRFLRRFVPFMGLAIPIMIARDLLDNANHRYVDN